MPKNVSNQRKSLLLVLLLLALWWFTPIMVKRWTRVAFYEFQAPAWTALSYLRDLQDYWSIRNRSKTELIEAGIDLSRLQAAYALNNQRMEYLEGEIERLEGYLSMPSLPEYRYEVARVIRRDLNAWWQQLIIRKGVNHGLRKGQAVVYRGGVVGRIVKVNAYTATVELISSPNFRTAAHVEGDSRPVEFRGVPNQGLSPPEGFASNVPADVDATHNDPVRLVSSRLGGTFPDGYTLGYIYKLDVSHNGIFQNGSVKLNSDLSSLQEVSVLVPLEPEETGSRP